VVLVNLERHLSVLWRYRAIVALGILLGFALAFFAAFDVTNGMKRRGVEQWSSVSQIFVTQEGFPWGRVTFPVATDPGAAVDATTDPTATDEETDDRIKFADPTRFPNLAFLYSFLTNSDQVRGKLPGPPAPEQIQAVPLDPTGRGDAFLPIIELTTSADTGPGAVQLNKQTIAGLKDLLLERQNEADISPKDRVVLNTISKPSAPALIAGRSLTPSMLAFMLSVILAIALAHILEGVRQARVRREAAVSWSDPTVSSNGWGHPRAANGTPALADYEPLPADAGSGDDPGRRAAR
jgi:hypothetical protein